MNTSTAHHPDDVRERTPPGFIAVEGPIGVGKTTLAQRLADTFACEAVLEEPAANPFLSRYYASADSARRPALATQLSFLFQRAQTIQDWRQEDFFSAARVTDFLIDKDPLFARVTLDNDEFALYEKVYQQLSIDPPTPGLVVYLQASPDRLLERLERRALSHERHIDRAYLTRLNEVYSEFFLYYDAAPLLIVNASELDLVNSDRDYGQLVDYLLDIHSGRHYFNPTFFG